MPDQIRENNFIFSFNKLPGIEYACQSLELPSVSLGVMDNPTTQLDMQLPGSKLIIDPITIEFMVDEDLKNYREAYNWLLDMRNPTSDNWSDIYSDCTLGILTNQKNHLVNVDFYNCFPSSLSSLSFTNTSQDAQILTASLTLEFLYFEYKD